MVASVDKFTAVKMYNKVQHYWSEEKKAFVAERNAAKTKEERDKILANTLVNLYEAAKPEIFELRWQNPKFAPILLSTAFLTTRSTMKRFPARS